MTFFLTYFMHQFASAGLIKSQMQVCRTCQVRWPPQLEHLFSASKVHIAVHFSSARVPEPCLHRCRRLDCVCLPNKRTTSPAYSPGWCSVDAQQGHGTLWAKGTSTSPGFSLITSACCYIRQEYAEALSAYSAAKECLSDWFFWRKEVENFWDGRTFAKSLVPSSCWSLVYTPVFGTHVWHPKEEIFYSWLTEGIISQKYWPTLWTLDYMFLHHRSSQYLPPAPRACVNRISPCMVSWSHHFVYADA